MSQEARPIRAVWRGHAPNCSSSGSVVGLALVSTVAAATVLNAWALRFARWRSGQAPPGGAPPRLREEADGSGLLHFQGDGAILVLEPEGRAQARAAGATVVGEAAPPSVGGALRAPTEVHLAVTRRCPVRCTACYLDAGPDQPHVPPADLHADLEGLAALGVFELAFGGGEALLREDLLELAAHARALGMVPNLTSSGFGLTREKARRMAGLFGQVNVSIDGLDAQYRASRGWDGASRGLAAAALLAEEGVRVGVNTVLSRPLVAEGGALEALGAALVEVGVQEWQWLRFKPAGRGAEAYASMALDPDLALGLWPRALALEAETGLVLRFDCALVPFLVAHQPPIELLQGLGVRGCPGGEGLWARDAEGGWAPCSFVQGRPAPDLAAAWQAEPTLRAWRDRAQAPPEPCASCAYRSVCRGGCRIVSAHLSGDALAPDPECPRVRAHHAETQVGARAST